MIKDAVADPAGGEGGGGAFSASAPPPEPSIILWDLKSSPGNWKWHKVIPLSIPLSDYQFDTLSAKILKIVSFKDNFFTSQSTT